MFNFIASALMVYLLVNVLKVAGLDGAADPQLPRGHAPAVHARDPRRRSASRCRTTPLNLTSILALVAAFLIWVLIWRTRLGYEMRTFGHSEPAARYAGIDPCGSSSSP